MPKASKSTEAEQSIQFPVVGIGASAGGIEALQKLIPAIDVKSGFAYIIVMHLAPDRPSYMVEIVRRVSPLPVSEIVEGQQLEPGHVYVTPPNATPFINEGTLHLRAGADPEHSHASIDDFFVSLAEKAKEMAACVILSGVGSDGTLGLRAIKENGGVSLAQEAAEYEGMMRSAVATGLVDFIVPAEKMPARIRDYFEHHETADLETRTESDDEGMARLFQLLRRRTGHDFSQYKKGTLSRRVQRRMHVLQLDTLSSFVDRLQKDPEEAEMLFRDLLIGVTEFFRDREAFEALQRDVVPELFEGKGPDDSVRVWVPGCSTGEEAYSLAILLREALPDNGSPKLQVFATDIDEPALELARVGRYPASIAQNISPERLKRFFQREDGTYRVSSELREICLFSPHNLLRDAPFSRLDMISCRNLLIYMNPALQDRIVPLFHYALRNHGHLFLGPSENVSRHSRMFSPLNKSRRIFERRAQEGRRLPEFPLMAGSERRGQDKAAVARAAADEPSLQETVERQILDQFTPAYVLINEEGDLLQASSRTGKYLELPAGAPDHNVFSMARSGLRPDLRTAVHAAVSSHRPSIRRGVTLESDGGRQKLNILVQPLLQEQKTDGLFIVVFQDVGEISGDLGAPADVDEEGAKVIQQLEEELHLTKQRLQTSTEELESSNEELKSANEELSSMNEELQSSNEELETSKEELQSVNEELQTVNEELSNRVEELSRAHNDLANLLESTQIATIFLDREFRIQSFTPAAKDLFRLVESDAERPFNHVRARFNLSSMDEDAQHVLRTLERVQRHVTTESGARYIMQILPYRTVSDTIAGVVLTFTDITRLTEVEAHAERLAQDLRVRLENLEAVVNLAPVGIFLLETQRDGQVLANRYSERLLNHGEQEWRGLKPCSMDYRLFQDEREIPLAEQPLQHTASSGEVVMDLEGRLVRADGSGRDVMISAVPLFDAEGKTRGALAAMVDVTHHKWAAAQQQLLLNELQHRVKNILATVSGLARQTFKSSTPEGDTKLFLERIQGMSRVHSLIWRQGWEGAQLQEVCLTALQPYVRQDGKNITLSGPRLKVKPNVASTLGMIFQELTTNATKYGALSVPDGKVEVSWSLAPDQQSSEHDILITWTERDGPPVTEPQKTGFGVSFMKGSIQHELEGSASIDFSDGGVEVALRFPAERHMEAEEIQPGVEK